jgi:hypothetical protein
MHVTTQLDSACAWPLATPRLELMRAVLGPSTERRGLTRAHQARVGDAIRLRDQSLNISGGYRLEDMVVRVDRGSSFVRQVVVARPVAPVESHSKRIIRSPFGRVATWLTGRSELQGARVISPRRVPGRTTSAARLRSPVAGVHARGEMDESPARRADRCRPASGGIPVCLEFSGAGSRSITISQRFLLFDRLCSAR